MAITKFTPPLVPSQDVSPSLRVYLDDQMRRLQTLVNNAPQVNEDETINGTWTWGDNVEVRFGAGNDMQIFSDGATGHINATNLFINTNVVRLQNGLFQLQERAVGTSSPGQGTLWVKNTTPTQLWFTDDAGTDTQIV